MKNKKFIGMVLLILASCTLKAQVKIGDNPNSINANSLLELESATKGFLAPRVTLTSVSSASPLTAPVPAGMLVYNNSGGSLLKGYYYWNGAKWVSFGGLNGSFTPGSVPFAGTDSTLTENNSQLFWNNTNNGFGIGSNTFNATYPEKLLVNAGTTTSVNAIVAKGTINNYFQLNINNLSNGASASSDVVATADNGSESSNYVDMGINGSGYAGGSIGNANDAYLYSLGNNFIIGNDAPGKDVVFFSNGGNAYTNERMRITSGGYVGIGNNAPACILDIAAGVTANNNVVNAIGSINDFLQFNIQNTSTGTHAQSGFSATADNGTATTGFAWLGINNSTFNFPTAYNIGGANDCSYIGSGQDMYIANANNTKSIIFSTGKATTPFFNERMRITNAGNVGIGTNAPNSTLQVTGSISTNIKAQTAATYTIAATDHTVFCNLAASMTVTLPTAVGISGRIYIIKNINTNSSSSITINTTSGQTIDTYASGGIVISYLGHSGFASTITLQSNGSNWYILSIY